MSNTVDNSFETGEKAVEGYYACVSCAHRIYISKDGKRLPACPNCDHTYWMKI